MKNEIVLDLTTILSLTNNLTINNISKQKQVMEQILGMPLTNEELKTERLRVSNYILENYPMFEGLKINQKCPLTWLETQKQVLGNEFPILPISERKCIQKRKTYEKREK